MYLFLAPAQVIPPSLRKKAVCCLMFYALQGAFPSGTMASETSEPPSENGASFTVPSAPNADATFDLPTRFAQAVAAAEQARTVEAIALFTALVRDYPQQPEIANNLAVVYAAQGDDLQAAHVLQQLVHTAPHYVTGLENLGDVYARLAHKAFAQALQQDNSRSQARSKLALAQQMAQVSQHTTATPSPSATQPLQRTNAGMPHQDIATAVHAWANAWQSQDMPAYYAAYSPHFSPAGNLDLAQWKAIRKTLIVDKPSIALSISDLQTRIQGQHASAHFIQDYAAGTLKSKTTKTLHFERLHGQWLIVQEKNGR